MDESNRSLQSVQFDEVNSLKEVANRGKSSKLDSLVNYQVGVLGELLDEKWLLESLFIRNGSRDLKGFEMDCT